MSTGDIEYRYRYGKPWHTLYGAKLLENIVQALARMDHLQQKGELSNRQRSRATK